MYYHTLGNIPKKRHIIFRQPNGELYREELMGLEGFFGISSLLYKESLPPAAIKLAKIATPAANALAEKKIADIDYFHFKTSALQAAKSLSESRIPLMANDDVLISVSSFLSNEIFRNASHHELYYLDHGAGELVSEFGVLTVTAGDYVVIPKGITYFWRMNLQQPVKYLLTQSREAFTIPKNYLNERGQFLEHAPFCERDIKVPHRLETFSQHQPTKILIHNNGEYFEHTVDHHPFDTVGWDGFLYPYALSIHDFEPIVGRIHQPPYIHLVFQSKHFVVCNFVPRLFDFHQDAIPAPYFHHNIETDEVLYYSRGNFMSRSGIEEGSITLHPGMLPHGPQPGRTEASIGKKDTNELAVMIDTFRPLKTTHHGLAIAEKNYGLSWQTKQSSQKIE